MAYQRTAEERQQEKEMMSSDEKWPRLLLPLKRMQDGSWPEFGYLMTPMPVVRLGVMHEASKEDEVVEYGDWDALLDDGWVVD